MSTVAQPQTRVKVRAKAEVRVSLWDLVRAELARIVAASSVWDGRTANLDVTDTSGGTVTLRIAVSGRDPSDVFALQCYVREEIVAWLQQEAPYALPRTRVEVEQVAVTHDPQPEQVARLAEELVSLQHDDGAGAGQLLNEPRGTSTGDDTGTLGL